MGQKTCDACGGTGTVDDHLGTENQVTCRACDGRGYIETNDED